MSHVKWRRTAKVTTPYLRRGYIRTLHVHLPSTRLNIFSGAEHREPPLKKCGYIIFQTVLFDTLQDKIWKIVATAAISHAKFLRGRLACIIIFILSKINFLVLNQYLIIATSCIKLILIAISNS